jgi:hypothetical protein
MKYLSLLIFLPIILMPQGGFLLDILTQIFNFLQQNKDPIAITTALATVVGSIVPIILRFLKTRQTKDPVKITVNIDGNSITIEEPDIERATKLLEHFQELNPTASKLVTPESKVTISGKVSKKTHRRR